MKSAARNTDHIPENVGDNRRTAKQTNKLQVAMPVWTGPEYPRIPPGKYSAAAVRIIPPQYLRQWQRWSIGICFRPFSEPDAEVVLFLNLGKDMKPKRGSDFFRAWTQANGDVPMKGQKMDATVFLEDQVYEIEVVDARVDSEGRRKSDAEVYSKVKRIDSVLRSGTVRIGVVPIKRN
jgi:hypothetical protein